MGNEKNKNTAVGAGTGAAAGASVGSVAGPIGTAIGAIGGAVIGAVSAKKQQEKQIKEQNKANAATVLRENSAVSRQYKQFLQTGLNPAASAEVNSPEPAQMQAANLGNYGSALGSGISSAFTAAGNMVTSLENAEQQRKFQDNLARLQGSLGLVEIGYKNTLDRYNQNRQFVQETSLAIRDIETKIIKTGSVSSDQFSNKKTELNEYTKSVNTSYNTLSELFAKTGTSLTDFSKTVDKDSNTLSGNFSINPVKVILTGIDFSGSETTEKGFEKAKQFVANSEMSGADKKVFNKALDDFMRSCKSLEKTRTSLNQMSKEESHTIQQTGFGSYCEMVARIEELKQENEQLFNKLSPEYMFEYYRSIYNLNY